MATGKSVEAAMSGRCLTILPQTGARTIKAWYIGDLDRHFKGSSGGVRVFLSVCVRWCMYFSAGFGWGYDSFEGGMGWTACRDGFWTDDDWLVYSRQTVTDTQPVTESQKARKPDPHKGRRLWLCATTTDDCRTYESHLTEEDSRGIRNNWGIQKQLCRPGHTAPARNQWIRPQKKDGKGGSVRVE